MERWIVVWPKPLAIEGSATDLWSLADLAERERAARVRTGQPFMIRPDGRVDGRLSRYFNSTGFRKLRLDSQKAYVKDNRPFFDFLWKEGKVWSETTLDDYEDWEDWRRRAEKNPRRVAAGTWSRDHAAMRHLFRWASQPDIGYMDRNPLEGIRPSSNDDTQDIDTRPGGGRRSDVKWLTADAARVWKEVGLGGYTAGGEPNQSFRGRASDRNVAFVDLLFSSGLRLREGASLLDIELPRQVHGDSYQWGSLAPAVAKWGSGRRFCVATPKLTQIRSYQETSRAFAITRAQKRGVYELIRDRRVVTAVYQSSAGVNIRWIEPATGRSGGSAVKTMQVAERLRLYRKTESGLEPLWFWLKEGGTPFTPESWFAVFRGANRRNERVLGEDALFCTSKMARHSFALKMVLLFHDLLGLPAGSVNDDQMHALRSGNPWLWTQILLGHLSEETTRNTYLTPLLGVELEMLLEGHEPGAGAELMRAVAKSSPLVQDTRRD